MRLHPKRYLAGVLLVGLVAAGAWWFQRPTADPRARKAALQARASRTEDPETLLAIGEELRRSGESQAALDVVARAYERRFQEPAYSAALAELLLETGDVQSAGQIAQAELQTAPDSGELSAVVAEVLLRMGRYDRGLDLARRSVRLAPQSPRAWRALAHACAVNRVPDDLWPAFARARELAPDDSGLLVDYGEVLSRYGRAREAEAALREAAARRRQDPRALGLLGAHLGQRARSPGELEEAIHLLRMAASLAPNAPEPHFQLGRVLLAAKKPAEAAAALEEAVRLDPSLHDAWLPLGQAYLSAGKREQGAQALERYRRWTDYRRQSAQLELRLRRSPNDPDLLLCLAELQYRNGAPDVARRYLQRVNQAGRTPASASRVARLEKALRAAQ